MMAVIAALAGAELPANSLSSEIRPTRSLDAILGLDNTPGLHICFAPNAEQ